MDAMKTFFENVKGYFQMQAFGNMDVLMKNLPAPVESLLDRLINRVEKQTDKASDGLADWVSKLFPVSPELAAHFKDIKNLPPPVDIIVMSMVVSSIFSGYIQTWIGAQIERGQWKAREDTRPTLPDLSSLISLAWKEPEKWDKIKQYLGFAGLEEQAQEIVIAAGRQFENSGEIIALLNRGEIGEPEALSRLGRNGYAATEAANILKLRWIIPPVQDIISMAVREVFTPATVAKFGQKEDFPEEFADWAEKQGLTREWAENYWAMHWILPSMGQAFDMRHRTLSDNLNTVIDDTELDMLMKAQDIMPFWRDRLKKIAFTPYSRVDVRRMHAMGELSDTGVKRSYLDLGYDNEHAEKMMNFTIKYNSQREKRLTQTQILKALDWYILTPEEAEALLIAIDYTEDVAVTIISIHQYNRIERKRKARLELIEMKYKTGLYSGSAVYAALGEIGLPGNVTSELIEIWNDEQQIAELKEKKKEEES